mgnify:CR=1 FL=1
MQYHFTYKTTNLLNGKYYYGVHNTNDLNDGYLGSGKLLKVAIKKYGRQNFKREILEFFDSNEAAFLAESELVTREVINDRNTYNVTLGGYGNPDVTVLTSRNLITINKDDVMKKVPKEKLASYLEDGWQKGMLKKYTHQGTTMMHKDDKKCYVNESQIKDKIAEGWELGGVIGWCYIYKEDKFKCILKNDLQDYLDHGWVLKNLDRSYLEDLVWLKKDNESIRVYSSQVQEYLDQGWQKGKIGKKHSQKLYCVLQKDGVRKWIPINDRSKFIEQGWTNYNPQQVLKNFGTKGTIWMTNGVINKMTRTEEQRDELKSQGFWIGKIGYKKKKEEN